MLGLWTTPAPPARGGSPQTGVYIFAVNNIIRPVISAPAAATVGVGQLGAIGGVSIAENGTSAVIASQ